MPADTMAELPRAANGNDLERVRGLLAQGGCSQQDLDLALARAVLAFNQRRAVAELLIAHGADPNGQYGSGYGPIVLVTGECLDPDGLAFLLAHGADVTFAPIATTHGPSSPLIATLGSYVRGAQARKRRCLDLLIANGAVMPAQVTPAMLAIHRGDTALLDALIDRDPDLVHRRFPDMPYGNVRLAGGTLLHLAVEYGEIACIDLLLARGACINARGAVVDGCGGQTPIVHAVATNLAAGLPTLEHLVLHAGRWIDRAAAARFVAYDEPIAMAMTPLAYAEACASEATPAFRRTTPRELQLLRSLEQPAIGDAGFAAAVAAIDAGDLDALQALLRRDPALATARADESGAHAGPYFAHPALLWFVAWNPVRTAGIPPNLVAIASAIIDAGTQQADLSTTLALVASGMSVRQAGCQLALIDLLLARGAAPGTALTAAIQHGESAAMQRLLAAGAEPDLVAAAGLGDVAAVKHLLSEPAADADSRLQALHSAAQAGHGDILALLVHDGGVPVNARVGHGTTALHVAALGGHDAAVDIILRLGADPALIDGVYNATPAGWADHAGHQALATRLRSRLDAVQWPPGPRPTT